MKRIPPKSSRLRLAPELYENLRQQVLRRDGWRCQSCGTMSNLEAHHRELRSQSGADSEENLITLCAACHARVHGRQDHKRVAWFCFAPRLAARMFIDNMYRVLIHYTSA